MTLFEKISADIADGNEGEMLDMQCKNQMEAPHLWQDQSDKTTMTTEGDIEVIQIWGLPSPPLRKTKSLEFEDLNLPTLSECLKANEEATLPIIEEAIFMEELSRSQIVEMRDNPVQQEDTYEEFLMKLCE